MSYVVKGKAFWTRVKEDTILDDKYTMDLSVDEKDAELLKNLGLKVKETNQKGEVDERGTHVTFSAYTTNFDGDAVTIKVVDSKLQPFEGSVGNGSEVNVEFYPKKYPAKSKIKGSYGYLMGVQIVNLVEYEEEGGFSQLDEGFVAAESDSNVEDEAV